MIVILFDVLDYPHRIVLHPKQEEDDWASNPNWTIEHRAKDATGQGLWARGLHLPKNVSQRDEDTVAATVLSHVLQTQPASDPIKLVMHKSGRLVPVNFVAPR